MDNEKKTNPSTEEVKLDDAKRVQVLSPGMMVAKRFFRNNRRTCHYRVYVFIRLRGRCDHAI